MIAILFLSIVCVALAVTCVSLCFRISRLEALFDSYIRSHEIL